MQEIINIISDKQLHIESIKNIEIKLIDLIINNMMMDSYEIIPVLKLIQKLHDNI